jgi:hypothetical protein
VTTITLSYTFFEVGGKVPMPPSGGINHSAPSGGTNHSTPSGKQAQGVAIGGGRS